MDSLIGGDIIFFFMTVLHLVPTIYKTKNYNKLLHADVQFPLAERPKNVIPLNTKAIEKFVRRIELANSSSRMYIIFRQQIASQPTLNLVV